MKVRCVKSEAHYLTTGKEYVVQYVLDGRFSIIDNQGVQLHNCLFKNCAHATWEIVNED